MKIRWTEDSIRFRIAPAELQALRAGQAVRAALPFPGGWQAGVYLTGETTELICEAGEASLLLSRADALRLAAPENEGVYFEQSAPRLRYYIEKDYPCEHPRPAEAQESSETFERLVSSASPNSAPPDASC